jgi:phosphoserine phosphatase
LHRKIFENFFQGSSKQELTVLFSEFWKSEAVFLSYPPVMKAFRYACKKGHFVALLSASPDFITEHIAKQLQVDLWGASRYSVSSDGKLDNFLFSMEGPMKARWLLNSCLEKNISLSQVTAYADSFRDLSLLKIVGHPIAVNPDSSLRREAYKNSWTIL